MLQHVESVLDFVGRYPESAQNHVPHLGLESGVSGIAFAAHLLGKAHDVPALMTQAGNLVSWMRPFEENSAAFAPIYDDHDLSRHTHRSILHGPMGYLLVSALVGDESQTRQRARAAEDYLQRCAAPFGLLEFAFGSAGALWGCARLVEDCPERPTHGCAIDVGLALMNSTWVAFRKYRQSLTVERTSECLGFAHGRSGLLYAVMAFCIAAECEPPREVNEMLEELACLGEISQRGISWASFYPNLDGAKAWPGERESWCNGAAGFVPLWYLAHELFGKALYSDLATKTAAFLATSKGNNASLCCGLAGHAVALGYAERLEPQENWRVFATRALEWAGIGQIELTHRNCSLFKGALGVLLAGTQWL